jgi:Fe-S-cluster containining protein
MNPDSGDLAALIREIGFACRRCGACCRPGDGDSGLVFLSHGEVEALVVCGAGSRVPKGDPAPKEPGLPGGGGGTKWLLPSRGVGAPLDWVGAPRGGAGIVQGGGGTKGLGAPLDWSWDEVAAPYPDFVSRGDGSSVTFGWCIRHENGRCRFLGEEGCTVYSSRPWICRTYPFSLVDGELAVSDCAGLGDPISPEDALLLAEALLARARAEAEDEKRVRAVYATARVPAGRRCVVDSAGLTLVRD